MLKQNNPNKGINEAQPFQNAVQEAVTEPTLLTSHNNQYHVATDWFGNVMDAPDKNNPTRPKYERPLDTVRSFEYAIARDYGDLVEGGGASSHRNSTYSAYHPSVVAGSGGRESVQNGLSTQQQYYAGKTAPDSRNVPISANGQRKAGGGGGASPMEYNNNGNNNPQRYPHHQQQPSPPTTPRQPVYRFSTTSIAPEGQTHNGTLTPPGTVKQDTGKKSKGGNGWKRFSLGGKS